MAKIKQKVTGQIKQKVTGRLNIADMRKLINKKAGTNVAFSLSEENKLLVTLKEWELM